MSAHVSPAGYCSSSVVVLVHVLDLEFALLFKLVLLLVLLVILFLILFTGSGFSKTTRICGSVQVLRFRLFFDTVLHLFLDVHAPVLVPGLGSWFCL